MPIFTSIPITACDQESFHAIDRIATGIAFDIHNEMGRYLDERLYQAEMAARLAGQRLAVVREAKITVMLDGFHQDYFADLVVNGAVIIESKTVGSLAAAHQAQVLNYVYLCGVQHATLLNFRTERVQHEFVSTHFTPETRRQLSWDLCEWKPLGPGCEVLHTTLQAPLPTGAVGPIPPYTATL